MLVTEIQLYEALKDKIGEEQVKAITSYVEAKFESKNHSLATRNDVALLKGDLELSIAEVKAEIISSKVDILRWMIGTMIAVSGLIIAAFKLF